MESNHRTRCCRPLPGSLGHLVMWRNGRELNPQGTSLRSSVFKTASVANLIAVPCLAEGVGVGPTEHIAAFTL
jgi:hypothetical protein